MTGVPSPTTWWRGGPDFRTPSSSSPRRRRRARWGSWGWRSGSWSTSFRTQSTVKMGVETAQEQLLSVTQDVRKYTKGNALQLGTLWHSFHSWLKLAYIFSTTARNIFKRPHCEKSRLVQKKNYMCDQKWVVILTFNSTLMCTRARACAVWVKFVLTVQFVECMFYCKFDGSYYGDKVIWTGLCSCTLEGVWVLECLVASRTSVTRSKASEPSTSWSSSRASTTTWGPAENADRSWRIGFNGKSFGLTPALRGRGERRPTDWITSTWWTGRGARWRAGLN